MLRKKSVSGDKQLSRQDAFELPTDSGSDDGSCDSNPFDYIKFYTGKKCSNEGSRTEYETFIDHGEACETIQLEKIKGVYGCIPEIVKPCDSRCSVDSLVICSKAVRVMDRKSSSESVIHTSTARLNIGDIKQQLSESSHLSSFNARISGNYMACEDLANMNDEVRIKKVKPKGLTLDERHSMPTLFVGNRFNNSDLTEVYIPSWKDKSDVQKQNINLIENRDINEEDTDDEDGNNDDSIATHSSSIDLPAILPAPDQIQAELLYNLDGNIIRPPSMFETEGEDPDSKLCLTKKVSTFKTHSIDYDKSSVNKVPTEAANRSRKATPKRDSVKRCLSYQYVQLGGNHVDESKAESSRIEKRPSTKCKCCESSQCPSPRSSDSGMAGSCTIASPDPPKLSDDLYYPLELVVDGSELRNSQIRHSQSSNDLGRFDVCGMFRNKFLNENVSENTSRNRDIRGHSAERTLKINRTSCLIGFPPKRNENESEDAEGLGMYKTGLYAHWWKKEKLPTAIVQGIIHTHKSGDSKGESTPSSSSDCRTGSGKRACTLLKSFSLLLFSFVVY